MWLLILGVALATIGIVLSPRLSGKNVSPFNRIFGSIAAVVATSILTAAILTNTLPNTPPVIFFLAGGLIGLIVPRVLGYKANMG